MTPAAMPAPPTVAATRRARSPVRRGADTTRSWSGGVTPAVVMRADYPTSLAAKPRTHAVAAGRDHLVLAR